MGLCPALKQVVQAKRPVDRRANHKLTERLRKLVCPI